MSQFYVAHGRAVSRPDKAKRKDQVKPFPAGTQVFEEDFGAERFKHLIKKGFIVEGELLMTTAKGRIGRVSPSPWTCDPESVKDLSLDQLNVRIHEIDSRVVAFETVEEAAQFLSKDYSE